MVALASDDDAKDGKEKSARDGMRAKGGERMVRGGVLLLCFTMECCGESGGEEEGEDEDDISSLRFVDGEGEE